MIVEAFWNVVSGFVGWVATLMPVLELPTWLVNADGYFNDVMAYGDGLGAWVNWPVVVPILLAPLGFWVIALGVRAARALAAHVPFIGGKG